MFASNEPPSLDNLSTYPYVKMLRIVNEPDIVPRVNEALTCRKHVSDDLGNVALPVTRYPVHLTFTVLYTKLDLRIMHRVL